MKLLLLLLLSSMAHAAAPLKTVMYNASGVQTSCTGGLTTDSSGRVNGCASGGLSGGTNGFSAAWTGSTSLGLGVFSDNGSTATALGKVNFQAGAGIGSDHAADSGISAFWVYATSKDGVTESSGCIVAVKMSGVTAIETATFTSTTTDSVSTDALGVILDNSCAPSTVCRIAIAGIVHAMARTGVLQGNAAGTFTTRCQGENLNHGTNASFGRWISSESNNWAWLMLSPSN